MEKKIIAFYDLLIFAIICGPLVVAAIFLLYILLFEGWSVGHLFVFAISFVLPIAGTMMFSSCNIENNNVYFHYFPVSKTWVELRNNIDSRWNQYVLITEIKSIEIVKLTEEEKRTIVYYKHFFNKYLKINMKYGNPKYVYVGNYSNYQIQKILKMLTSHKKT